jgi:hypothetical protein
MIIINILLLLLLLSYGDYFVYRFIRKLLVALDSKVICLLPVIWLSSALKFVTSRVSGGYAVQTQK